MSRERVVPNTLSKILAFIFGLLAGALACVALLGLIALATALWDVIVS